VHVEHQDGQTAFLDELAALLAVAGGLDDEQLLTESRCRGWAVGDVLVHVHLGLQEMLLGVVTPAATPPDTDAANYWRTLPPADRVAQVRRLRLLGAVYQRPVGLVAHLLATGDGVASAVSMLPPRVVRFQGHALTTGDFLTTWAVELAVHHLDLAHRLELPPPATRALQWARRTVETLAGGELPWDDETTVLLGTGRRRPDHRQARQAGPLAARLPVLG
jgi:Mycothiol maleylpyruvate isomerase N-terminal domain